jgi:hypothetical protein
MIGRTTIAMPQGLLIKAGRDMIYWRRTGLSVKIK